MERYFQYMTKGDESLQWGLIAHSLSVAAVFLPRTVCAKEGWGGAINFD